MVAHANAGGAEGNPPPEDSSAGRRSADCDPAAEAAMTRDASIRRYLHALSKLCAEVAAEPKLLPTFLQILLLVPRTVAELAKSLCK
jgi:hypothetical protein